MKTENTDKLIQTIARSPIPGHEDQYYYTDYLVVLEMYDRPVIAIAASDEEANPAWLSFDGIGWWNISCGGLWNAEIGNIFQDDMSHLTDYFLPALALWHAIANPRNPKGGKFNEEWRDSITPSLTFDQALHQRIKDRKHADKWKAELVALADNEEKNEQRDRLMEERIKFLIECYGPTYLC